MGLTYLRLRVANPARPEKSADVEFLVDSGALNSLVPGAVLRRLGIAPTSEEEFFLANGERIARKLGNALFLHHGRRPASPVIFGARGDSPLLGIVTLEALGYVLDPFRRELRPIKMMLA